MSTTRCNIADGPAAHVIFDHLKYAHDPEVSIPVNFHSPDYSTDWLTGEVFFGLIPTITGVEHEDGSGQSLNLTGYVDGKRFEGYYNARTRKGFLEIKD